MQTCTMKMEVNASHARSREFDDCSFLVLPYVTQETKRSAELLGKLETEAAAVRERIESAGALSYGTGAALIDDLARLRRILDALDAIAKDPAA